MKPVGISSTWWVTMTIAGDVCDARVSAEQLQQFLPRAEVEAGRRFVEQQQLRVGHHRPRDLHPLLLAVAEGAELAVLERVEFPLGEHALGPADVDLLVVLASSGR